MSDILVKRLVDLKLMCGYAASAFMNLSGGIWNKFCTGGATAGANSSQPVKNEDEDSELFAYSTINELFDRLEIAKTYRDALENVDPALDAMQAKRQSDMLSSMQQATRLRYMSRIRHMSAAQSRDRALFSSDIEENIYRELVKK